MDSLIIKIGYIFREKNFDKRYILENVIEISLLKKIILYISIFVFYYYKGSFIFYNNLDDISKLNVNIQIEIFKSKKNDFSNNANLRF